MLYPFFILSYWVTSNSIIKALPCLYLALTSQNPAFIFAGLGDFLLEEDYFLHGICMFLISNLLFYPFKQESLSLQWLSTLTILQPMLYTVFDWYFIIVDIYILSLINLLWYETLPAYLFVASDIFVLGQFLGFPWMTWISLPLYWSSMMLLAMEK
jgi:hypothetical protein